MPREASGELRRLADGFAARITITGRERRDFVLVARLTEAQAEERKTELARMAARLRRAGHADKIVKLIGAGAKARQGRPWAAVVAAVDTVCSGEVDALADIPTFADFAKAWTSGALRKRFPDHVSEKDATPDESYLRLYINPHVGDVPVNGFTLDDADLVMAHLPETKSSSTRRHVGQVIRRVLALAVYPARYLKENPIPRGWLPKVKQVKAFTHVYPDEDRALLACRSTKEGKEGVPLVRRLFYGVLTREGMRRDELGHARWRDFDLTRGQVMLDENKTDDPRSWVLDPDVVRALRAWKECYCAGAQPDDFVFVNPEDGVRLYTLHLADELRRDLRRAGVTRSTLFERSDVRCPIRVHDLRATFVTVSLANGRTETWVADRTGHRSSVMINRYRRAARTWAELAMGPLAPLDEAIPELRLPHGLPHDGVAEGAEVVRKSAESKGFEPLVPLRVHLISNQAPSATRTALRRASCREPLALSSGRTPARRRHAKRGPASANALASTSGFPPGIWSECASLAPGEMTEWPKVHDWKSCVPARVPRVRIPLSPQGKSRR
jgi:integrase